MTTTEQKAVLTVCLMAAFADGQKSEVEHGEIRRIAGGFPDGEVDLPTLYQDVLLRRVTLEQAVQPLAALEARQLAYELAVCLCEADAVCGAEERQFLAALRAALKLEPQAVVDHDAQADALARLPAAAGGAAAAASPPVIDVADADAERSILNHAILAGALELLPSSLATMAIIPLQMKLVYSLGTRFGYTLDRGHIKEFLATMGVGLTSQVFEQYATKLMGGLLGRVAGGLGRALAGQATSSAMSFATTYALGHAALRYYSGGRTWSAVQLRQAFNGLLGDAQTLSAKYLPAIQEKSRNLDPRSLLPLLRQA